MDLERRKKFKKVIKEFVDSDDFNPNLPRSAFREIKNIFSTSACFEELDLRKEFLRILDELKVTVREESPFIKKIRREQKKGVVTLAMLRGARKAEHRHRQMLGKNY